MHLTYNPELSKTELMQGDVLERTPTVDELLQNVHPHFYQHQKNLYFMVLTQSCDLAVRNDGTCKAQYITLAPVRSLDLVVERHLAQFPEAEVKAELPVLGARTKNKVTEFLQRLFNNNEPGYFFLDSEDTPLDVDCAALLNLSIAVKADLHRETCLKAKVLQLEPTFQAKLGWLVGQMYSRVGTADWDPKKLNAKVARIVNEAAIWVDDGKLEPVEEAFRNILQANPDALMTAVQIAKVLSKIPDRRRRVLNEASRVVSEAVGKDQAELAEKIRKRLEGDAGLSAVLRL